MYVRTSYTDTAGPQIDARVAGMKRASAELSKIAKAFSDTVVSNAPQDTGWLVRSASATESKSNGTRFVVGPYTKLGSPRSRAPRGTIRRFLEDYPQYAFRSKTTRKRKRRRAFPSAWHFLSAEAKKKLRDLRRSGAYGMDGPAPRYWQAIQENRVPGQGGAMGGKDFLTQAYIAAQAMSKVFEKTVFGR